MIPEKSRLRALTLRQPWAWAITHLPVGTAKRVENRPWRPPDGLLGGAIALHAGQVWDPDGADAIENTTGQPLAGAAIARGAVVGTAKVIGWVTASQALVVSLHPETVIRDARCSPWFFGLYGWILRDVRRLADPVPCRGHQRLWRLPVDIAEKVAIQVGLPSDAWRP